MKLLIGLAGIFAAGAVVGALYAPDKGERTRRRLTRKGKWMLHATMDAAEAGRDKLEQMRDEIKNTLEHVDETLAQLSGCQTAERKD